jgi:hypothetical protein
MIHFGQMRCGKVDQVENLFHVVSEFFQINFIPVVPLRSYLVLHGAPPGSEIAIPLNGKSVLMGYIRTALVLLVLFNSYTCVRNLASYLSRRDAARPAVAAQVELRLERALNSLALVTGLVIFFGLTYRFSRPRFARVQELAALIGMTEEDLADYLARGSLPAASAAAAEAPAD